LTLLSRAGVLTLAFLLLAPAVGAGRMVTGGGTGDGEPPRQLRTKPPTPAAVHPVVGATGYGEAGARFGASRGGRAHEGQDVFAPAGTPLVAVRDGVVLETGNDGGRGNYLALFSPAAGETYLYLHMVAPSRVAVGERVSVGQRVGEVGCTGSCFGDHLHFEVRSGRGSTGAPIDPLERLLRWKPRRGAR